MQLCILSPFPVGFARTDYRRGYDSIVKEQKENRPCNCWGSRRPLRWQSHRSLPLKARFARMVVGSRRPLRWQSHRSLPLKARFARMVVGSRRPLRWQSHRSLPLKALRFRSYGRRLASPPQQKEETQRLDLTGYWIGSPAGIPGSLIR